MTENHSERTHALLGGSSAGRWSQCPGSVFYIQKLPPQESSEAALEGTAAHEIAEVVLNDFLEHKVSGIDPNIRVLGMNPDADMLEAANGYRDAFFTNILKGSVTGKGFGMESRFVLDEGLQMSGLCDSWAIYIDDRAKRVGALLDFKYGFHPVPAKNNPQLIFYLAAMLAEVRRGGKDLDYMVGAIYQPRAFQKEAYSECRYTVKEIEKWTKKFYKAAEQIFVKKKPTFKVGDWCQFCPAKGVCVTYGKEVSAKSSLALIDPDIINLPPIDKLPDETLSRIILNADSIEEFIKAVKNVGIERAKRGNPIIGTKCVYGTSRRKWKENEEQVKQVLGTVLAYEDIFQVKLKGITDIEKLLTKTEGKNGAKQLMSECCDMSEPSIILVESNDPRDSIQSLKDKMLDNIPL